MKRAAAADADSQTAAQRARLTAPVQLGALSPAQRCVPDLVAAAFSFLDLPEVLPAAVSCRAWYTAAGREKPREMQLFNSSPEWLVSLLSSRSPLRRHVSDLILPDEFVLNPSQLQQLQAFPALTVLDGRSLDVSLQEWTSADWRSLLPLRLRDLALGIPKSHTLATRQQIIDALPVMQDLSRLNLGPLYRHTADPQLSAQLSLEPLLQLPQLKELIWSIGDLTLPQLAVIKQIETLRCVSTRNSRWTVEQLTFLSQPPHRLDQLEEVQLFETNASSAHMAALIRLPGITRVHAHMRLDAIRMLPRLSRLQQLAIDLRQLEITSDADRETLHSSMRACSALTWVEVDGGECSEAVGERLLRAAPHLRKLSLSDLTMPSLRFLRHAPSLTDLELFRCRHLRVGHILSLGSLVPQLERLRIFASDQLLDRTEVQALTPPGAIGLPHLRSFSYDVEIR
jgi:hypothetical protein